MAEQLSPARRAGLAYRRKHRHYQRLEWPALRAEILARNGIGPSPDYDSSDWRELGLYRANGRPPDIVAAETYIGRADRPPWQGTNELSGTPDEMLEYLRRARHEYQNATPDEQKASAVALGAAALARRRELKAGRSEERRQAFGTARAATADEQREHARRMEAFVAAARAQHRARRAAKYSRPAIGFYTDEHDVVRPITAARRAGAVYAARRGRPHRV